MNKIESTNSDNRPFGYVKKSILFIYSHWWSKGIYSTLADPTFSYSLGLEDVNK
jgi:hypothetical protein